MAWIDSTQLVPEVAIRAIVLGYFAQLEFGTQLEVVSAFRSDATQKALQARWDAGNRAGLSVRPADHSKHSEGKAFDLGSVGPALTGATWARIGSLGELLGLRWGGRFSNPDPHHFDY